ncbi:hypothetical protein ACFYOY_14080 [Streptomyces sp. NPDC007875]|uniref:hypothetical protein n=1 Tax=Streptomyces sp. NPDC007875 TaxID=3364783 RepID=UPI00367A8B07
MNPHRMAVESAKRIMADTEDVNFRDMDAAAHAVGSLRGMVRTLLAIVEAQPKSARLRLQHDEEFLNLLRALRMDGVSLLPIAQRFNRLVTALSDMAEPDEDGGRP